VRERRSKTPLVGRYRHGHGAGGESVQENDKLGEEE
jgi:hypothetical protein